MSSDSQNTSGEQSSGTDTVTTRRRPGVTTAITVIATAALTATGSFVIANSTSNTNDDAAVPSGSGTLSAETVASTDVTGEERGLADVHQEETLVSTEWLAERLEEGDLQEQNIVLLDVSENLASSELTPYSEAHIPQAQYVEWSEEFTQPNTREFISEADFTELARSLGINEDSTVVIYGDNNNWFAAYASWVFKLYGAEDVRLLDGGLHKWEAYDNRELVEEVPAVSAGNFTAQPQNFALRAFQPEVLELAEENVSAEDESAAATNLVDIRSGEEHRGEVGVDPTIFEGEGASIWGHIPGSVNVTWTEIVDEETGEFLPAQEIRDIYEDAGVNFDNPIIAYCRIGERASHTWYALSQILGEDVKVYDGSWSEWGNSVGVPVANSSGERAGLWGQQ